MKWIRLHKQSAWNYVLSQRSSGIKAVMLWPEPPAYLAQFIGTGTEVFEIEDTAGVDTQQWQSLPLQYLRSWDDLKRISPRARRIALLSLRSMVADRGLHDASLIHAGNGVYLIRHATRVNQRGIVNWINAQDEVVVPYGVWMRMVSGDVRLNQFAEVDNLFHALRLPSPDALSLYSDIREFDDDVPVTFVDGYISRYGTPTNASMLPLPATYDRRAVDFRASASELK